MRESSRQPGTRLIIQAHPGARRNEIKGLVEDVLHIGIAAPPVEGKANRELIEYLSELLGISKSAISIERGATSRRKVILIEGIDRARILALLGVG